MANYDMDDIVEVKRRAKRRKRRIKLIILIAVAAIAGGMYYNRDKWLPKLQGIGEKYHTIINDGELAEGNFPIEISGGENYQLEYTDKVIYLMSDAYTYLYNEEGGLIEGRQHAYSNAVMKAADGYALIYETGGNKFRLESERETLFTDTADDNIIFGRVSDDGYTAIVTLSDKFACSLTVYDRNGNYIYNRNCIERIIDVCFTDDGNGAVLSFVNADNGSIVTKTECIKFDSDNTKWTAEPFDTYCIKSASFDDGAVVLGDDKCAYYNNSGEITASYTYDGSFAGCDISGSKAAVILNDNERHKYNVMLLSGPKKEPFIISYDEELRYVQIYDGLVYVMGKTQLKAFDFSGNLRSTVDITDSYSQFRRCDKYIFLMSYDRVDRIDFES